jgi:hypothetical protein
MPSIFSQTLVANDGHLKKKPLQLLATSLSTSQYFSFIRLRAKAATEGLGAPEAEAVGHG